MCGRPLMARVIAPKRPPGWPPAAAAVWSPMLWVIQDSSPDSAKIHSWGWRSTSRTGRVVPRILYSIFLPSASADDHEAPVGAGQEPRAVRLDDDVVLDPHASPAGDVDARLDRH